MSIPEEEAMPDIPCGIPTEEDFKKVREEALALPDIFDEALANNRLNNLLARAPTEVTRDGQTYTTTSPAMAAAWVDDVTQQLRLMAFAAEIDGFERDQDRRLDILNKYFPDEYERICNELWAARENVKQLRW